MPIILTAPTNAGLVAYYSLDEGTGSTAHDMSGNNNNGTLVNSPAWVDGILGKALSFNGVNQYDNILNLNMFRNLPAITISAWIKLNIISGVQTIFFASTPSTATRCGLFISATAQINIAGRALDSDANQSSFSNNNEILPNIWYHVVGILNYTTNTNTIYKNGVLLGNFSVSFGANISQNTVSANITIADANLGNYFNGSVDEIRIYNRALSQQEITTLYQSGATKLQASTTNGLVGYWSMDEGSGTISHDYSGNNNNGTLVNFPIWTDGILGKCLRFNGGITQKVDLPVSTIPTTAIGSISAWIKTNVNSTLQNIISSCATDGNTSKEFRFDLNSTNQIFCVIGDGITVNSILGDSIILPNRWYYAVLISNGSNYFMYVNGILQNLSVSQGSNNGLWLSGVPNRTNFQIGLLTRTISQIGFNGLIDEVRIYNRVLSQSEITTLYQAGITKITAGA